MSELLDAYYKSVELKHQQDQLEFERENAKNQLKLHQNQIDETSKQHASDLKLRTMIAKQEMNNHYNQLYGNMPSTPQEVQTPSPQGSMGGQAQPSGDPQNPISFTPPQQNIPQGNQPYQMTPQQGWSPEMQQMFGSMMIDPKYQEKQLAAQVPVNKAAVEQARQEGEAKQEPIRTTQDLAAKNKYTQALDLQDARNSGLIDKQTLVNKQKDDASMRTYLAMMARIANANSGNNPDDAEFLGDQVADGSLDYSKVPPKSRPGVDTYLKTHNYSIPTDTKKLNSTIEAAHSLFGDGGLMSQYQDAIENHSADSTVGAIGNNIQSANPFSDVSGVIDNLNAQAGIPRKYFDSNNRSSESEALRTRKGIYDPAQTKANNYKNYYSHLNSMTNGFLGDMAGLSAEQQNQILNKKGVNLGFYDKNSNQVIPVYVRDKKGKLRKYDPTHGGYVPAN